MTRTLLAAAACAVLLSACGSKSTASPPAASPDVWATVDGREIKRDDVEKAYRRTVQTPASSDEEALAGKLSVLNELITQSILVARAKGQGLEPTPAEVDAAMNDTKKNMPDA